MIAYCDIVNSCRFSPEKRQHHRHIGVFSSIASVVCSFSLFLFIHRLTRADVSSSPEIGQDRATHII